MKYLRIIIVPLLLLAALLAMGGCVLRTESEVLFRMQELSLFLPTKHFLQVSTIYPGGILTWLAAFMTQFFFHPVLGMGLMLVAWAIIMAMSCRLFRLRGVWQWLSLLTPLALTACLVQTGYWIYYMKLQGYPWVPTLGVLFSLAAALIHGAIPNRWGKLAWLLLFGIAGYPLMGAWSFLGVGLMTLTDVRRNLNHETKADTPRFLSYASVPLAILLIAVVPQVYVQWCYGQVQYDTAYFAAMPSFQYGKTDCPEYRYAYYALAASFLVYFLASLRMVADAKKRWLPVAVIIMLLAAGVWGVNKRWERDTNFHKEVAMTNAIHRLDWEEVLRIMVDPEVGAPMPPTRVMVMMKNLALFRLGRAGNEMFRYPEGAEQQHAPWQVRMTQVGGKLLYYHYGKAGFCYRWCMEDGVEFGWSVDVLKYMTKTSLLTHDWKVAKKYIDLLKQTRYHREWAEKYETFIGHPERMEADEEMQPIVPMSQFPDRLDGDNTLVEMYLLKTFSGGFGADPYYQEMTLICSLIMKDIELFWPRFHQYLNMHQQEPGFRVPTHYQEAAYLYSMLEPQRPSQLWPGLTNAEALQRLPFDQSVKESYKNFMDFNTQCGSMTDEQKKVAFRPQYGNTFYYFYFLMRNQKTN